MKVWKNNEKIETTYEEVCANLGFIANVHFVKITSAGTIDYTVGKPNEIKALYSATIRNRYKPSKNLDEAAGA